MKYLAVIMAYTLCLMISAGVALFVSETAAEQVATNLGAVLEGLEALNARWP